MLEPKRPGDDGIILAFKTLDCEKELTDTVKEALSQIQRKKYGTLLVEKEFHEKTYVNMGLPSAGRPY